MMIDHVQDRNVFDGRIVDRSNLWGKYICGICMHHQGSPGMLLPKPAGHLQFCPELVHMISRIKVITCYDASKMFAPNTRQECMLLLCLCCVSGLFWHPSTQQHHALINLSIWPCKQIMCSRPRETNHITNAPIIKNHQKGGSLTDSTKG